MLEIMLNDIQMSYASLDTNIMKNESVDIQKLIIGDAQKVIEKHS